MLVICIGRGHSGTRALAQTLRDSGIYMGEHLNVSMDLLPPDAMYEAARIVGRQVRPLGRWRWDFSTVLRREPTEEFRRLVLQYAAAPLSAPSPHGWKLPETTLAFPWIVRMFPEAHYIYWTRDPRDNVAGAHVTDQLSKFGVEVAPPLGEIEARLQSWTYQADLVAADAPPQRFLHVRFEDFVLDQAATLDRMSDFLSLPLTALPVDPSRVGCYRHGMTIPFMHARTLAAMERLGYRL